MSALTTPEMEGRAPLTKGSRLAREHIIAKMVSYGLVPGGEGRGYVQDVRKKLLSFKIGHNVVGFVAGRLNPEECVYVDAHYDHWGKATGAIQPGANDNASGVALMLELARLVSRAQPDRTVVFLASDYEEGALFPMGGAIKGADYHVREPLCAKEKVKGALVLDTVGGPFVPGLESRLFLIGSESSRAVSELVLSRASAPDRSVSMLPMGVYAIEPLGRLVPRADYGAFRRIKVPFLLVTSGLSPDYHMPTDTIEKLDFEFMEKAGGELFSILMKWASADFQTEPFRRGAEIVDWDRESALVEGFVDEILERGRPPAGRQALLERLRTHRSGLRKQNLVGTSLKRRIQKIIITILRLNGALKFKEHLYRAHNLPRNST